MSSTEFTVGLDGSRVSSKVLKPPGGGSSDIFGLGSTHCPALSNDQNKCPDNSSRKDNFFGPAINDKSSICTPQRNAGYAFVKDDAFSISKKQYVPRNPITGEGLEYTINEKVANAEIENKNNKECRNDVTKKDVSRNPEVPTKVIQTSIRVRNPPGGKSSGIF